MKISNHPLTFWDYFVQRRAYVKNMISKDTFKFRGTNPHTELTGEQGNISNICQYDQYEWCYFRDQVKVFTLTRKVLGRVLGTATGEGNEMSLQFLKANGEVVPRRSYRPLKVDEQHSEAEKHNRTVFDLLIERRHGQ